MRRTHATSRDAIAAHRRYLETRVFGSLDGLRAMAILAVVWQHATGWHQALTEPHADRTLVWAIGGRGFLGVDLFFVISGFLIVTLLLRERRRSATISLRGFYARRSLRIFPAYYLMLGFVSVVCLIKAGNTSQAVWKELPFAALYVSNLVTMHGPLSFTWSLAAEEQFYLVVPTLEKYFSRLLPWLLPLLYVLLSLPPFGFFPGIRMPDFFRNTTFGPILLGVILAHVLDGSYGYGMLSRLLRRWSAPLVCAAAAVVACGLPVTQFDGWPRLLVHWSFAALVASCVVHERHALTRFLSAWPIKRIGIVSYGVYLYHPIALYVAYRASSRMGLASEGSFFVVSMLLSWAIAELSYRLFESRFLALKAKLGAVRTP